jgi:hypothetical protein
MQRRSDEVAAAFECAHPLNPINPWLNDFDGISGIEALGLAAVTRGKFPVGLV